MINENAGKIGLNGSQYWVDRLTQTLQIRSKSTIGNWITPNLRVGERGFDPTDCLR